VARQRRFQIRHERQDHPFWPEPAGISLVRLQASLGSVPLCTALLGRDDRGAPLLAYMPAPEVRNILIAGVTGSGKTGLLRTMLSSLALANDPDDLRVLLVSANSSALAAFEDLPHLVADMGRNNGYV